MAEIPETYFEAVEIVNRWRRDLAHTAPEAEEWRWGLITEELADLLVARGPDVTPEEEQAIRDGEADVAAGRVRSWEDYKAGPEGVERG